MTIIWIYLYSQYRGIFPHHLSRITVLEDYSSDDAIGKIFFFSARRAADQLEQYLQGAERAKLNHRAARSSLHAARNSRQKRESSPGTAIRIDNVTSLATANHKKIMTYLTK